MPRLAEGVNLISVRCIVNQVKEQFTVGISTAAYLYAPSSGCLKRRGVFVSFCM